MQFLRDSDEEAGISLTSLIDVIFLLLIFFMVTTTIIDPSRRLDIEIPEAKAASIDSKSTPVTIEMNQRGNIVVDGAQVGLAGLEARLKSLGSEGRNSVLVRADKQLDYGRVVAVLGVCRASGFHDIGLAVRSAS